MDEENEENNQPPAVETEAENVENEASAGIMGAVGAIGATGAKLPTFAISKEFDNSNKIVYRLGFILLVFLGFVILTRLGIEFITWLGNSKKIVIINGMVPGDFPLTIYQDPSMPNYVQLPRSNNMQDGLEFSYSVWIYIQNGSYMQNNQQYFVFNKGNSIPATYATDASSILIANAPGVYLKNQNTMTIIMNCFGNYNEKVVIEDLPIGKWFNLIIRVDNDILDVFINGNIYSSVELLSIPKQNYGNLNIGVNNGFPGSLSNLTYYAYSIGTREISNLMLAGPNTNKSILSTLENDMTMPGNANFISTRWYYSGIGDMYNGKQN